MRKWFAWEKREKKRVYNEYIVILNSDGYLKQFIFISFCLNVCCRQKEKTFTNNFSSSTTFFHTAFHVRSILCKSKWINSRNWRSEYLNCDSLPTTSLSFFRFNYIYEQLLWLSLRWISLSTLPVNETHVRTESKKKLFIEPFKTGFCSIHILRSTFKYGLSTYVPNCASANSRKSSQYWENENGF